MVREYSHTDRLGRQLQVGDCVAAPHRKGLMIATIQSTSPKMIQLCEVGKLAKSWGRKYYSKYASDTVKLDGPEVTMYLLKFGAE